MGGSCSIGGMRRGERGFTLLELTVAMLIIVILTAVVLLIVTGMFGGVQVCALEQELDVVQKAVDTYAVKSEQWPTSDGKLPAYGEYAPIAFLAGFEKNGKMYTFYPHYIATLPKHYNEGVWRIGSNGAVSVDMDPEEY